LLLQLIAFATMMSLVANATVNPRQKGLPPMLSLIAALGTLALLTCLVNTAARRGVL